MKVSGVVTAGSIVVALAALALVLQPHKVTPEMALDEALNHGAGLNAHVWTSVIADPQQQAGSLGSRRGLSADAARELMAWCAQPARWAYIGDEAPRLLDGAMLNGKEVFARYSIMQCQRPNATLIARLDMNRELVDHPVELVYRSDFLACRTGQCPDFAVGDPGNYADFGPAPKFKIENPARSQ